MSESVLSSLQAQVNNVVRSGVISAVQQNPLRVKVAIGELITDWLRCQMPAAGPVSISYLPSEGEAVQVTSECGNLKLGVAQLGLHNIDNPPPTTEPGIFKMLFTDGTAITYDMNRTVLEIVLSGGKVSAKASPDGWNFKGKAVFEDEVNFKKPVTADETINATGNIGSAAELSDKTGTMSEVRQTYNSHTHDETDSTTHEPNQRM
ncbi:phage baseplate assembly protein V [Citrobacter freundii]|nr:phage baseplate assembly protein V [Citrobacter freundii]